MSDHAIKDLALELGKQVEENARLAKIIRAQRRQLEKLKKIDHD